MKAISLWQPWASLIAIGAKRFETRSWATNYRGPLLICAAKTIPVSKIRPALREPVLKDALRRLIIPTHPQPSPTAVFLTEVAVKLLPSGVALCIVDLVDCIRTENLIEDYRADIPFGDFSYGRFAWKLESVRAFKEPFPVRGAQGLFKVDDSLIIRREMKESFE